MWHHNGRTTPLAASTAEPALNHMHSSPLQRMSRRLALTVPAMIGYLCAAGQAFGGAPPASGAAAGGAVTEVDTGWTDAMREVGMNPINLFLEHLPRMDLLNHPGELLDTLAQLHLVWAGIFITAGLFAVLNGYRWHRTIVIVCTFLVGMGIGHAASKSMDVNLLMSACIGCLAAVVAWPLMKYAIAASGGVAGAFAGANLWTALNQPPDTYYAGALIGLVAFGLLSFIFYKMVIVAMTCIAGAFVLVLGAITMLIHVESWGSALRHDFTANPALIPLLVLVAAVIGFVVQQNAVLASAGSGGGGGNKGGAPGAASRPRRDALIQKACQ